MTEAFRRTLARHRIAAREGEPIPTEREVLGEVLRELDRPIPVTADEACHTRADLDRLEGLYDVVNIKLDKTGGLTEALALADAARSRGFDLMIGCMIGTSLGVAPAMLLATGAAYVDLDAPLLLARDRPEGIRSDGSTLFPPDAMLWG